MSDPSVFNSPCMHSVWLAWTTLLVKTWYGHILLETEWTTVKQTLVLLFLCCTTEEFGFIQCPELNMKYTYIRSVHQLTSRIYSRTFIEDGLLSNPIMISLWAWQLSSIKLNVSCKCNPERSLYLLLSKTVIRGVADFCNFVIFLI